MIKIRLWHKKLIKVLPRNQLLGQVRELTLIIKNISIIGTPNHILVNKIMDYSMDHLYTYCNLIIHEMKKRNYKLTQKTYLKWHYFFNQYNLKIICFDDLFYKWHNDDYYKICYYNLYEKYLCGGITKNEFLAINNKSYKI